jgi:CO/xanthine dehydrogenase Mo-binding subunit
MTAPRGVSRRTFLISSAGGALVVGCALGPTAGPAWRHYRAHGELRPNAWSRILADNAVIFTLDRVEMGQCTTTSHATLECEELELDPARLTIEAAEADRRYDNPDKQLQIRSREDDQQHDWYRPMAVSRMRGAVEAGAITGWLHRLVTQSVLFSEGGDLVGAMLPNGAPRAAAISPG